MSSTAVVPAATRSPFPAGSRRRAVPRGLGLLLALALLAAVTLLSIAVGSKPIGLGTVVHDLLHNTGTDDGVIVRSLRLPRTLIGLAVGAALGLAGALMQALTRNPLADPGLLGVNAGASAAIAAEPVNPAATRIAYDRPRRVQRQALDSLETTHPTTQAYILFGGIPHEGMRRGAQACAGPLP